MKKGILRKSMLFLLLLLFVNSNIKAISQFPESITIKVGNLMPGNFNIFKKSYVGSDGNSGKAFCSSFWNDVYNNQVCYKTSYHSDSGINEKAQAAVGAIINRGRNADGSFTWNNYYYTELAINEFLYKKVTGNSVNNLNKKGSFPYEKGVIIQPAVNLGYSVYDSYKSEVVVVSNLKINNISINGNIKDLSNQLKNADNYIVTADMKCYKDNTKKEQVACSNPQAKLKVQVNSGKVEDYNVTKTYSGNTVNLKADISALFKNASNTIQSVTVDMSAESKKTYYLAQRYNCGAYVQTMTPNLLKPTTVTATVNTQGKFSIQPQKGCGDEINSFGQNKIANARENARLYRESYKNYGMLLDINNPSCSPAKTSYSSSCDVENGNSIIVNAKRVKVGQFDSNAYDYLCTISFIYDSDTMINKSVSGAKKLIYENKEGEIGRAKITYDCNVPSLAGSSNSDVRKMDFKYSDIVPKLKIKLDNTQEYEMDYKIDSVNGLSSECRKDSGGITCDNYNSNNTNSGRGYGWDFEVDIVYSYPETFNYSMDRGGNIYKTGSCSSCEEIGYGIYVPENTEASNDEIQHFSKVKFEFSGDYEIENNNLTVSCPYTIKENENSHKDILYHTIDTDKPFSSYTGKDRLTGANWCSDSDVDSLTDLDDFGVDNSQMVSSTNVDPVENKVNNCIYKGDINQNYKWDSDDIDKIQKSTVESYTLSDVEKELADANFDTKIDILDASTIQKAIRDYGSTKRGDVNFDGLIDKRDALMVQENIAGFTYARFNIVQIKLADLNNNCRLESGDVTLIQKLFSGDNIKPSESLESSYEGDTTDDDVYATLNDTINLSANDERTKKCANNNDKVISIIKKRPNSNGDFKIQNEDGTVTERKVDDPLYRFVLTPDNIKNIRANNKENKGYSNFDSVCDKGEKCVSNFVSQLSDKAYVSAASGLCNIGTYCDITNVIQQNYIKGGA